jgi:autotransporter strand-loop-strand O-heptosyltransferase
MINDLDIKVSFVSNLPLKGDSPKVIIKGGNLNEKYLVEFFDYKTKEIVSKGVFNTNMTIFGGRQWFTDWFIQVTRESDKKVVHQERFIPQGEVVFIKIDAYALGDTLAWIPYVEEFRKKHNCKVICSTFHNKILIDSYPKILFTEPNVDVKNVYAQYYIGASKEVNIKYSPTQSKNNRLQYVASSILGLENKEIRPNITSNVLKTKSRFGGQKYVCISEFASGESKHWKDKEGWQKIVDYLNEKGYKVVVISKEYTNLKNVVNCSGNYSLEHRMIDLFHCEFYMGVSSGLAWLAWSLGKNVVMISDGTPINHEFERNCIRISANPDLKEVDFENYKKYTKYKDVIKILDELKVGS